jgi:hypothetical protein
VVDQLLLEARLEVEPLLADDSPGARSVGVIDLEVNLGHLVLGVPLVAEAEYAIPIGPGDSAEGVAAETKLFLVVARGDQEETGMAVDLFVIAELDDEIAISIAEVVEPVFIQEGLDHVVAEALDESHAPGSPRRLERIANDS